MSDFPHETKDENWKIELREEMIKILTGEE